VLLRSLTASSNQKIKDIVVSVKVIERLFGIMNEGYNDNCLSVLLNLLKNNENLQRDFYKRDYLVRLRNLFRSYLFNDWSQQQTNIRIILQVTNELLAARKRSSSVVE
jgi:hypothetical protein